MKPNEWHEIPFRCLLPKIGKSVIVAGRCISSDFVSQTSYRIIPNCLTLGQAAAVGAMLANEANCNICEVNGIAVRRFMLDASMLPSESQLGR